MLKTPCMSKLVRRILEREFDPVDKEGIKGFAESCMKQMPPGGSIYTKQVLAAIAHASLAARSNTPSVLLTEGADLLRPVFGQPREAGSPAESTTPSSFADWYAACRKEAATQCMTDFYLHFLAGRNEATEIVLEQSASPLASRYASLRDFALWKRNLNLNSNIQDSYRPSTDSRTPVCSPVLIGIGDSNAGAIVWLSVELFQDGFAGFVPDFLVMPGLNFFEPRGKEGKSFLKYVDDAWRLSALHARGFSGRWRLLHRPPLHRDFEYPQLRHDAPELMEVSGPSAQAAFLVSLLAASGYALSSKSAIIDSAEFDSQYLDPRCAVTASITEPPAEDPRDPLQLQLAKVGHLNQKLAAVTEYSPLSSAEHSKHRIQSMLLGEPSQKSAEDRSFYGVNYIEISTVQQALDLMLESNRWREAFAIQVTEHWENRWTYPFNQHGQYLNRNGELVTDSDGRILKRKEKTQKHDETRERPIADCDTGFLAAESVSTGSLAYQKKPIGGATYEPARYPGTPTQQSDSLLPAPQPPAD